MKTAKCIRCGAPMQRIYERYQDAETKKRMWIGIGWHCTNPNCNTIEQD